MSQQSLLGHERLRLAVPLVGRDPDEPNRAATPLELFFDLVFVVAVAQAADRLHHGLVEGAVVSAALSYVLVFFAIYWAWLNFTWFASAFDTDDITYRLFVFATIVGALVFAAGVPRAFDERDFGVVTLGYTVMRVAIVSQWLRVAVHDGEHRRTARRAASGLTVLQVGWLAALALPADTYLAAFLVLAVGELAVPVWYQAASPMPWNNEHISERYGLFMIIVLGESVLAASMAIQRAIDEGGAAIGDLISIVVGGLLVLFSIWWTYFERPRDRMLDRLPSAFAWAYLHLVVFAAVAAVGAGIEVAVEAAGDHGGLGHAAVAATVTVPVAAYLVSLWGMYVRRDDPPVRLFGVPVTVALVLAASFAPAPIAIVGGCVAGLVALKTMARLQGATA